MKGMCVRSAVVAAYVSPALLAGESFSNASGTRAVWSCFNVRGHTVFVPIPAY